MFTVPPGGDGMYYFSMFLTVDYGEAAFFDMMLNAERICSVMGDHMASSQDLSTASCSAVAEVSTGSMLMIQIAASRRPFPPFSACLACNPTGNTDSVLFKCKITVIV